MALHHRLSGAGLKAGLCGVALMTGTCLHAQTFEEAVRAASTHDAQYLTQKGAVESRRLQARQAGTAYWPYATASYTQKDTSSLSQGRTTTSLVVTQPLLSYDRYLQLQQGDTLAAQADAEARQAAESLVLRVFSAMAKIVGNREAMRAGDQQISGLGEQLKRARRMKELGQGTVTEVSDFEVRVAMAEANQLRLKGELQAAERTFEMLTGVRPVTESVSLDVRSLDVQPGQQQDLIAGARQQATAVTLARNQLEQANIGSKRKTAQFMPQVVAQAYSNRYSNSEAVHVTGIAVSVAIPISGSSYYDHKRAAADIARAEENLRYVESTISAEMTTLIAASATQREEITVRERAVEAAKLAVEANTKSYMGGIKSNIDILSSYQNLIDAETALVNARIRRMEIDLQLDLKSGQASYMPWLQELSQ